MEVLGFWTKLFTKCVAVADYQILSDKVESLNKNLDLSDLKVKKDFRRKGVSKALINKGFEIACQEKYKGLYTIAQDNNIVACQFYLKQGFAIGGFNNRDYQYTQQEGKADVYFYLDKLD